jgi:hypothetical protein
MDLSICLVATTRVAREAAAKPPPPIATGPITATIVAVPNGHPEHHAQKIVDSFLACPAQAADR